MTRVILSTLFVFLAFWLATSAVIPASIPESSRSPAQVIWRKTDTGWIRAENWLVQRDYLYQEPEPPIYPLAVLPMMLLLSITALILNQPATGSEESIHPRQGSR
ncbi:hypothetical protein [Bremerella cremea]|uniref:hypothetical protein n=1 Tax=Bremerella cremea TaxID=1031537 RepID=UPI0011C037BB|nr:hypothetical protein [Bremerella cremea]